MAKDCDPTRDSRPVVAGGAKVAPECVGGCPEWDHRMPCLPGKCHRAESAARAAQQMLQHPLIVGLTPPQAEGGGHSMCAVPGCVVCEQKPITKEQFAAARATPAPAEDGLQQISRPRTTVKVLCPDVTNDDPVYDMEAGDLASLGRAELGVIERAAKSLGDMRLVESARRLSDYHRGLYALASLIGRYARPLPTTGEREEAAKRLDAYANTGAFPDDAPLFRLAATALRQPTGWTDEQVEAGRASLNTALGGLINISPNAMRAALSAAITTEGKG